MSEWLNTIQNWDNQLLHLISSVWVAPWADQAFLFLTDLHKNAYWGIPFLGVAVTVLIYMDWRNAIGLFLALILAVALSDLFCYRVLKQVIDRPRPSANLDLTDSIRVTGQGVGNSFPSNHTANCFAAATVLGWSFSRRRKLFYILAGIIGYSRIYLGVHYPSDVIGGAIIGTLIGLFCVYVVLPLFHRLFLRRGFQAE